MQPIILNQTGKFAIIESNDKFINVLRIRNFHDDLSGFGQIIKEYSWSINKDTWSYWTILTQESLLALSDKQILPKDGFYFRIRYTLASIGNMSILDVGIDIEYDVYDHNKGYVPYYGYRMGNMGCVECGSMRGAILSQCNPTFNPYLVNPAIDIYKDINYGIQNMFGLEVSYMRAKPKLNSSDVVFKEWTLYDIEEAVCTKVLVPDNEFPDAALNYNPYGIDYENPFEVHIVKQNFEEVFGPDAAPQNRDVIYFGFMPNRLYEVKSSTPHRDFMMQIAYWKVDLMQYKSKADTYATTEISTILDEITRDSYEAFGKEFKSDVENLTKPQQYNRLIGTNLKDPIRKYINLDMQIYQGKIDNHATIIAEHYYDLSSVFNPSKETIAVQYAISSKFSDTDNFSYSCWYKDTKPMHTVYDDNVKIISVVNNVVKLKLNLNRHYAIGNFLQVYRQGKLNFYGEISNCIDLQTYEITVPNEVITHLNTLFASWPTAQGWYCKQCFEKILINGISESSTPVTYTGWQLSTFAERFFVVNINGEKTYFCLNENIGNTWVGVVFNYAATFRQMNLTLWKIKETRHVTTDLDMIYSNTINDIISTDKTNNLNYNIIASNIWLTNIRIFNEVIDITNQSSILNQNIIQDSDKLVLADNAYQISKQPFTGNIK